MYVWQEEILVMSQKELIVKGFVCIPKWSELHPVQQEARNRFYSGSIIMRFITLRAVWRVD